MCDAYPVSSLNSVVPGECFILKIKWINQAVQKTIHFINTKW